MNDESALEGNEKLGATAGVAGVEAVQADGLNSAEAASVLRAAALKIEPPGAWTINWWARDAEGRICDPTEDRAVCWCVRGALNAVIRGRDNSRDFVRVPGLQDDAEAYLALAAGIEPAANGKPHTSGWNDAPKRTQAQVVAALRKAADLADGAGHGTASTTDLNRAPGTNDQ